MALFEFGFRFFVSILGIAFHLKNRSAKDIKKRPLPLFNRIQPFPNVFLLRVLFFP
jgi:hypothetical protein